MPQGPGKGKTNNPYGRPPKPRALTTALCEELELQFKQKGQELSGKKLLAQISIGVLKNGQVVLPNGDVLEVSGKDYLDFLKWVYTHVDGPPRQEISLYQQDELDLSKLSDDDLLKLGKILEPVINSADTG